ncbi:MAG TPA: molybdopterin dinucleotide binding domain-containing protein, partial [Nitrospiria bacterium]|nr:molybdopterin dinucleotide binding domain-containing protein [Nitrospiria bacterium]
PDWEIFSQIAGFMGFPFEYGSEEEISAEIGRLMPRWKTMPTMQDRQTALERYLSNGSSSPADQRYQLNGFASTPQDRFQLVIGPTLFHSGKMSLEAEGLRRIANEGLLRISPADAAQLGVKDGETVKMRSSQGEAVVKVKIDGRYPPGLVFFPDSFNEPPVKDLLSVEIDPVTRVPYFKQCMVEIEKCN